MTFEMASVNLVVELCIIMLVLLGCGGIFRRADHGRHTDPSLSAVLTAEPSRSSPRRGWQRCCRMAPLRMFYHCQSASKYGTPVLLEFAAIIVLDLRAP